MHTKCYDGVCARVLQYTVHQTDRVKEREEQEEEVESSRRIEIRMANHGPAAGRRPIPARQVPDHCRNCTSSDMAELPSLWRSWAHDSTLYTGQTAATNRLGHRASILAPPARDAPEMDEAGPLSKESLSSLKVFVALVLCLRFFRSR